MKDDESYALSATGAGQRYGRFWALRDCSFTLVEGRIAALVWPNGAGATTLLTMIAGLIEPSQWRIEVFGRRMSSRDPAALADVGFVAQDHALYKGFTVGDLLRIGRALNRRWGSAAGAGPPRTPGDPAQPPSGTRLRQAAGAGQPGPRPGQAAATARAGRAARKPRSDGPA